MISFTFKLSQMAGEGAVVKKVELLHLTLFKEPTVFKCPTFNKKKPMKWHTEFLKFANECIVSFN